MPTHRTRFWGGLAALVVSALVAGGLSCHELGWSRLPGCGPGSRGAAAMAGPWGRVAGWPVAFVGLAFFLGLAADWIRTCSGRSTAGLRWLVRLGAAVSVGLLALMAITNGFSIWFLIVHLGNLAFWGLVEFSDRQPADSLASILTVSVTFALVTSLLNVVVTEQRRIGREQAQRAAQADEPGSEQNKDRSGTAPIRQRGSEPPGALEGTEPEPADKGGRRSSRPGRAPARRADVRVSRIGSADAPVQMSLFFDYHSAVCRRLEPQLRELIALRPERLAVTLRQFPLCRSCNPLVTADAHPNACRAARAAAAAGLIEGPEGFWRMHAWLMTHEGQFTDRQLEAALRTLKFPNPAAFLQAYSGPAAQQAIVGDVAEAQLHRVQTVPTLVAGRVKAEGRQAELNIVQALIAARERQQLSRPVAAADLTGAAATVPQAALPEGVPAEALAAARAATLRVAGTQGRPIGSGVVVAVRPPLVYALTAKHVVAVRRTVQVTLFAAGTEPETEAEATSEPEPESQSHVATVVALCQFADLAILRFAVGDAHPAALPICPAEAVPRNWPFEAISIGCEVGRPVAQRVTVVENQSVRIQDDGPARSVWVAARPVAPGRSGGPLVDRQGFVLGIASGTDAEKGYFTDISAIHRFLKQQGLEWIVEGDPQRPRQGA